MKLSSRHALTKSSALLTLLLLSFALVLVLAPVASACQRCELIQTSWGYGWICNPALGPGHVTCYYEIHGTWCEESGQTCEGSGPGCFLAQTMVSTPDGDRPIETLKEGDAIWCVSDDGRQVAGKVTATLKHVSDGYYRLNGSTLVTGEHRFLAASRGPNVVAGLGSTKYEEHALGQWIPLKDISVGQPLLKIDGTVEIVETVDVVDRGVRVFNLEVAPYHNYFANKILVHNRKPDPEG